MRFWQDIKGKLTGVKDPNSTLDYPIDFSGWLVTDPYLSHEVIIDNGEVIAGGLVVVSSLESSGLITTRLSGGVLGSTHSFTIRITTVGGQVDDRTFYLKIIDR